MQLCILHNKPSSIRKTTQIPLVGAEPAAARRPRVPESTDTYFFDPSTALRAGPFGYSQSGFFRSGQAPCRHKPNPFSLYQNSRLPVKNYISLKTPAKSKTIKRN